MFKFSLLLLTQLFSLQVVAQYRQQVLYPNQEGQELLNSLTSNFKPDTVLPYGPARDTLYALIDSKNDSLTCVYTGLTIYLNPNRDPTQEAFAKNINTEHTWPQSNGASQGFARSDMHHLYPTRVDVNADRGSFPFSEIDDNRTEMWYYLDRSLTNIPGNNIDSYSEMKVGSFEPREDHKGDVARSMFYFYTIYRAEAEAAAPSYFEQQRETLCQWHYEDPVDEKEWKRSQGIARYQDDKANPFVLDCTLPMRSYCSDISLECNPVTNVIEQSQNTLSAFQIMPNPFLQELNISYELLASSQVVLRLYDSTGQLVDSLDIGMQNAGLQQIAWMPDIGLSSGTYFYQVLLSSDRHEESIGGVIIKGH